MENYLLDNGFYTLSVVRTEAGPQATISLQKYMATNKYPFAVFTLFIPTEGQKRTVTVGHV